MGWAVDPLLGDHPPRLFLFIDGRPVTTMECAFPAPETHAAQMTAARMAREGEGRRACFRAPVPARYLDNEPHDVSVRFQTGEALLFQNTDGQNTDGQNADGVLSTSIVLRLSPPPVLRGFVDGLNHGALRGWAMRQAREGAVREGGVDVIVFHAGIEIGRIHADRQRADVARELECDAHCGFVFTPPPRFRDGQSYGFEFRFAETGDPLDGSPVSFQYPRHLFDTRIARLHNALEEMSTQLWRLKHELRDILSENVYTFDDYDSWARHYQGVLRHRRRRMVRPTGWPKPLISIVCPVYRPAPGDFKAALESVLSQTYGNWELILVDDASGQRELSRIMSDLATRDPRVKHLTRAANGGISAATNDGIAAARGQYVAFLDHDDLLLDIALEIMVDAAVRTGARVLYSDEDKIDGFGRFSEPNLKSDWNYRLLLGQNYICHFLMVSTGVLREAGPLRSTYDGAQDHDLLLRLSEHVPAGDIAHVPEILYHWRKSFASTAASARAKPGAGDAGAWAVRDHLHRRGHAAASVSTVSDMRLCRIGWGYAEEPPVTVIIPFKEQLAITARCLDALLNITAYGNFQVVLVDNWSTSDAAALFRAEAATRSRVSVMEVKEPFNYSRLNNLACLHAGTPFFVFMNNDVVVEQPDWLRLMVNEALADPAVAAVGARLVYPDRTIQHGGVILGVGGVGDHASRGRELDDTFYMGRGLCAQELSAVTAALMLVRADAFHAVGGFDERELSVVYNDVDLCLKLRQAGHKVIYHPGVVAEHHESASRGDDMSAGHLNRFVYEEGVMLARWGAAIRDDPFYNPNFSREGGIFQEHAAAALRLTADPGEIPPR